MSLTLGIFAVDELTRAHRAVLNGEFRNGPRATPHRSAPAGAVWEPAATERVVLVIGCLGSAGASTVALGIATSAGQARVVECCTVAASGLAAASTSELGVTSDGWVQGSRGEVVVQRRGDRIPSLDALPIPTASTHPVTVLDSSWDLDLLTASPSWLGECARTLPEVIVVTRPTLPGLRRLETALSLLGDHRAHPVVVGVDKRWPKPLEHALGPAARRLRAEGRITCLPPETRLSLDGLTPAPLPPATLVGCADLFATVKGTLR